VLIIGQAPSLSVHRSGIPWDDKSGKRLREWLGIDSADFYDTAKVAIVPMGLCYPGKGRRRGISHYPTPRREMPGGFSGILGLTARFCPRCAGACGTCCRTPLSSRIAGPSEGPLDN
jgi:hypothetical protein